MVERVIITECSKVRLHLNVKYYLQQNWQSGLAPQEDQRFTLKWHTDFKHLSITWGHRFWNFKRSLINVREALAWKLIYWKVWHHSHRILWKAISDFSINATTSYSLWQVLEECSNQALQYPCSNKYFIQNSLTTTSLGCVFTLSLRAIWPCIFSFLTWHGITGMWFGHPSTTAYNRTASRQLWTTLLFRHCWGTPPTEIKFNTCL